MGKPKVLVIDDDPVVRRAAVRVLSPICDIEESSGGAEALVSLRDGYRPTIVLSDVEMPMVDGPSVYRSCIDEELLHGGAFIFMSGSRAGDRISFLIRENMLIVRKPFEPAYLLSVVEDRLTELALTRLRKMARVGA